MTVKFIDNFIAFWEIINVDTLYADTHMRDLNKAVIPARNDEKLQKLIDTSNLEKHARCLIQEVLSLKTLIV